MKKKKRILFIVHHRKDRSPGQRFRCEQYLDFLAQHGYDIDFSVLLDADDDKVFYSKGNLWGKLNVLRKAFFRRCENLRKKNDYDVIFIFREAFMTGTTFFEKHLSKSRAKLIFDFDDSIWIDNVSEGNKHFAFLKNAAKTSEIISYCDMVFAGNQYLADYAAQYNSNVVIVPTTIDTNEYQRLPNANTTGKIIIGWSGSVTTIQHFKFALPFLQKLKAKYGERIEIKVIGDGNYRHEALGIVGLPWRKEDELRELSSFDIGIMPLPDDKWAKGKCGLKGLQYMALEIPTLMSPVGVNAEIIEDGVNGYLATEPDEWVRKIEHLIEDETARNAMGKAGRQTVVERYSVLSQREKYLAHFDALTA